MVGLRRMNECGKMPEGKGTKGEVNKASHLPINKSATPSLCDALHSSLVSSNSEFTGFLLLFLHS